MDEYSVISAWVKTQLIITCHSTQLAQTQQFLVHTFLVQAERIVSLVNSVYHPPTPNTIELSLEI